VVASTTGYSAIVAPDGNLITSSGTWQQAELEARVPLIGYTTLADRVGAWPEWVIVCLTALALCLALVRAGTVRAGRGRAGTGRAGTGRRRGSAVHAADSPADVADGQ
jgi:apolipoprotein N-acyltransferase